MKNGRRRENKPDSTLDKLGYTFYPKDWWTSATFFKLPPELRYLYLEIISMMYVNDGEWKADRLELHRRFGVDPMEKGWEILQGLFYVNDGVWTHPSVNKRLKKAIANRQNGQLGGRPKTQKTQLENPKKPTLEREREREGEKESKGEVFPSVLIASDEQYWGGVLMNYRHIKPADILTAWEGWYVNKFEWRKKELSEMRLSFETWLKDPHQRKQAVTANKYKIQ